MAQPPQTPKCGQNGAIRSRAGALDREQAPAVGMMPGTGVDLDGLAAQRVRHVDGLAAGEGDAVAAMADMIDDEAFNHGARRGRIRYCRRRR